MMQRFEVLVSRVVIILIVLMVGVQLGMYKARQERLSRDIELRELIEEVRAYEILIDMINCESGFRHDKKGDNGKAYGILQFHKATFYELAGKMGVSSLDWRDPYSQLIVAKWAIKNGYGRLWSCYRRRGDDD